jgi:hypothetical protein
MSAKASDYLDYALGNFRDAQRLSGEASTQSIGIGDALIQFHFAGKAMARHVMRALAHLKTSDIGEPDLSLHVWDNETTRSPLLQPAWGATDYEDYGRIRGFNDDRFHAVMQFNPHILRCVDYERRVGIYWCQDADALPYHERGAPLRPLLHDWLERKGMLPIHGGVIGTEHGGVLLAGSGGAGKSNAALSCWAAGLRYLSDDFCCLAQNPWTAYSLYSTGKVHSDSLHRLPQLAELVSNPAELDTEKALFFLAEKHPDRLIRSLPLRAIVLPRVCPGQSTQLLACSAATVQKALAISTIEMSRNSAAVIFSKVAALLRALPCYELRVGDRGDDVPTVIRGLLSRLN